jgi:uncharacterized protein (TIGR02588 family)
MTAMVGDASAASAVSPDTRVDTPARPHQDEAATDPVSRRDNVRGRRRRGDASSPDKSDGGERSAAEWATLVVSSLIVLGLIAVTTYFYITGPDAPVAVQVEPRPAEVYQAGDRFYLPISIHNRGGQTGTDVRVRVNLTGPDERQEGAEVLVDFLAGGGTSKAVVSFGSDPRQGQIEAGVTSYLEP